MDHEGSNTDVFPSGAETESRLGELRVLRNQDWMTRFPSLVQGITTRATGVDFGDRASPGSEDPPEMSDAWRRLGAAAGIDRVVRCRQVHGAEVLICDGVNAGVHVCGEGDAMATADGAVLLTVTVADCVPVFMVDPDRRILALAHAGWRGTASGVAEAALEAVVGLGSRPDALYVHLGPSVCGECYEVGPEVASALGAPAVGRSRVDLRSILRSHLVRAGIDPRRLSVSDACTLHHPHRFYSFRGGGRGGRMCAFLGLAVS